MDEDRKNKLLQEKLEGNVRQAQLDVDDRAKDLEYAKMDIIASKRVFEDYCCKKAGLTMSEEEWEKYHRMVSHSENARKARKNAKTIFENAKTILYQAQKELQDFLDSIES